MVLKKLLARLRWGKLSPTDTAKLNNLSFRQLLLTPYITRKY